METTNKQCQRSLEKEKQSTNFNLCRIVSEGGFEPPSLEISMFSRRFTILHTRS